MGVRMSRLRYPQNSVILMIGAEGIAVGMATKILPHNFGELLQAQIAILENGFKLVPDFIQGGLIDS